MKDRKRNMSATRSFFFTFRSFQRIRSNREKQNYDKEQREKKREP
jgi:hypothetical protein